MICFPFVVLVVQLFVVHAGKLVTPEMLHMSSHLERRRTGEPDDKQKRRASESACVVT